MVEVEVMFSDVGAFVGAVKPSWVVSVALAVANLLHCALQTAEHR